MKGIIFVCATSVFFILTPVGCKNRLQGIPEGIPYATVAPVIVTDTTKWDTDDPAVWINHTNPAESLIIGTDKNRDGALYAFDLRGKIVKISCHLERPNNVDIAYGFPFQGEKIDIAVVTERMKQRVRVFSLPGLDVIDQGDLVVFNGDTERAPMGIALYKRPRDEAFFILISGKSGPVDGYIGQYRLETDETGKLKISFVRQFGQFSGRKEVESLAVDEDLGFVYYSDETIGVRKYHADPDAPGADRELALFCTEGFANDHEGISIYKMDDKTGYILVSDQGANRFWIYTREGFAGNPHEHRLMKIIGTETTGSDGSEVTGFPSPDFPYGLFVAMSTGKTFHYYDWADIAGEDLEKRSHRVTVN